jgi:hypothetical protein
MKNVYNIFLITSFLLFSSCGNARLNKVFEKPDNYYFMTDFEMLWDGKRPVQRFVKDIKIDEPFVGENGYIYVLKKTEDDSVFRLNMRVDRTIYDPPYYKDEEYLRDRY